MIIKYTNNEQDVLAEYLFLIRRTDEHKKDIKSMRIMYYVLAGAMGAIGIYNLMIFFGDTTNNIASLSTAISQFIVALLTLGFSFLAPGIRNITDKITLKNKIKKEKRTFKENTLDITSNQIKYSGDKEGIIKGTEQKLVHEDKKYLYIVARKAVLTIPKEKIENLDELKNIIRGTKI